MVQARIPNVSIIPDEDNPAATMNKLEYNLRNMLYEQIEYLCGTCANYLGLVPEAINPKLLWKPLTELPEAIADLETCEDDELQINTFILQSRFDGKTGIAIAFDVALKINEAIKDSFDSGNDAWGNRADFEMGCLQVIHDLAKAFNVKEVQQYAEAFRFSNIGEGA